MPVSRRKKQPLILPLFIPLIVLIDQYLKYLVRHNMKPGDSIPLIKNILYITFVTNTGAAFGILKNGVHFFAVISIIAICWASVLLVRAIREGVSLRNSSLYIRDLNTATFRPQIGNGQSVFRSKKPQTSGRGALFVAGLILIIAGATGNLIDRIFFSYVIDFIDVRIWPVFNISDSSITIGTALLIYEFIRRRGAAFDK